MFLDQNEYYRTVTIGESAVGKTAIITRLVSGGFKPHEPATTGASFLVNRQYINGKPITLQIWDTAGQEKFKSLGPLYYRSADVGIVVFSLTNRESFENLDSWLDSFISVAGKDTIICIAANKSDLQSEYEVSLEEAQEWADLHEFPLFVTSALNGDGVRELFDEICGQIDSKGKAPKSSEKGQQQEPEKSSCC
ncbi:small GTP-binding protein [Tritrichomonas foetus]|uniref:Small GTP-binding protein n=1 Tax=Tritrichomonas foetus TaxID=1144522 RepID=A0A1J4JE04_9EUKA|nr:small GTP-binding protein [Tritrichomonas foetus]|eukprot:OHS96519.1 small GTP-binding protein [Tritrichomonas foetus]